MARARMPKLELDNQFTGLVVKVWQRCFYRVWERLWELGLYQDWRQQANEIAFKLQKLGFQPGSREAIRVIYRNWYAFLRECGFHKTRHYGWVYEGSYWGGITDVLYTESPNVDRIVTRLEALAS